MFPSCFLPQRSWLDAVGFVRELLPAAEGRYRAGLHARADSRPGPAVLPLLYPLAAGQDHRRGSQQGAEHTSHWQRFNTSLRYQIYTQSGAQSYFWASVAHGDRSLSVFLQWSSLGVKNLSHYWTGCWSLIQGLTLHPSHLTPKHHTDSRSQGWCLWWTEVWTSVTLFYKMWRSLILHH